ncbi:MAG: hypothetical protein RL722_1703 [Pseudomonadota bacterium]
MGWDVGGAHLKAALLGPQGELLDVAQWPCPLWQGQDRLSAAIAQARARWPGVIEAPATRHGLTMTAEMVDLFPDRAAGVSALAAQLALELTGEAGPPLARLAWYAGPGAGASWLASDQVAAHWRAIASANYLASASLAAAELGEGVLADVGSTTSDFISFRGGRVLQLGADGSESAAAAAMASTAGADASRLATGELVYQGVVRTPLIALAQRVPFGSQTVSVMNELFATTADVYRLTGELPPAHDQQPAADGGAKTILATQQRLARMIGRDAADGREADWLALARFWRSRQIAELAQGLQSVLIAARLGPGVPLVAAGCGAFLVAELARDLDHPCLDFATEVLGLPAGHALAGWAQVCAPAVAVALLLQSTG